ncbi:MAG: hypothetical protein ACC700_06525 [Anaerolineales bacterium]
MLRPETPEPRDESPETWRRLEDGVLAPLIMGPDSIQYTADEEL